MKNCTLFYLVVITGLFCVSGASCPQNRQLINDNAPVVLSPNTTLEELIRVVNTNSSRVQKIQSTGATLTVSQPGVPSVEANYAFERPYRFRLRAETRLTGPELDLGSNDEIYWMWVKQNQEKAVYWGRHDQFYQSAARGVLAVPPQWLIEALGVVEMDPTGEHEGPYATRPGHLEVRSRIPTPAGHLTKITVIESTRGWIVEQHVYDATNQHLASAFASGFQYDERSGVSLPRQVEIRLPPANMAFTLKTERHLVNQIVGDDSQLWSIPKMDGYPYVDLANPAGMPAASSQELASPNPYYQQPVPRNAAIRRLPPFDRLR